MPRIALKPTKPKIVLPSLGDNFDDDSTAAARAYKRVRELEHELRILQNSNREVIKDAEKRAKAKGEAEASHRLNKLLIEKDAKIQSLKTALDVSGQEWACPECGCLILPQDVIRRETDA